MPEELKLWRIGTKNTLEEMSRRSLDLESRLEEWLEHDISILADQLLVIGKQVPTDFGGYIDLLCVDDSGDLVLVELKKHKTPREVTAQALDYASWVADLNFDDVTEIADKYVDGPSLKAAFKKNFGAKLPDTLNERHRILIVASQIDADTERIVKYLSDQHGVDINVATFSYFKDKDNLEMLARVFLLEPENVEYQSRTKGSSKRRPNLTYEQLEQLARDHDVGEWYQRIISTLEEHFSKGTTRNSIRFQDNSEGSRRVVFSLWPEYSDDESGLNFQLYLARMAAQMGISEEAVSDTLPTNRKEWSYAKSDDPDWSGFEGYFTSDKEVERFLKGITDAFS